MAHSQSHFLCGEARGDAFTVHFLGNELILDESYTRAAAAELVDLARECGHPQFLVDLDNVAAVSTQTLVALVSLRQKLLATGRLLTLCNLRPAVAGVLAVTGLERLFPIIRNEGALEPTSACRPATSEALPSATSQSCPTERSWIPGCAHQVPTPVLG
jgi:anti-anti-sigma factor